MALLLSLLLACSSADYGVGKPDPWNEGGWPDLDVRIDVAWQDSAGAAHPGRCQLQVAFLPLQTETGLETGGLETGGLDSGGSDTGADDPGADEPGAGGGQVAFPDEPGTCAFSERIVDPDDPGPGDADDNWQTAGAVVGPETVELQGDSRTWVLDAVEVEAGAYADGGVRYELVDCEDAAFPFGEVLDLYVPPGPSADTGIAELLPELFVPAAVVVGPRVRFLAPLDDDGQPVVVPTDQDLDVRWDLPAPWPEVDDPDLALSVRFLHQPVDAEAASVSEQWLACDPLDSDGFTVPAADLARLTPNADEAGGDWTTSIDVHSELATPEWSTPWGTPVDVRAHVSQGAPVLIVDPATVDGD